MFFYFPVHRWKKNKNGRSIVNGSENKSWSYLPRRNPLDISFILTLSPVKTGVIRELRSGGGFLLVFTTLEQSSAATHDADVWRLESIYLGDGGLL